MKVIELDELGAKPPAHLSANEASAWRRGYNDFIPRDQTVFNPYNADTEARLYDAWEAGQDAAAG